MIAILALLCFAIALIYLGKTMSASLDALKSEVSRLASSVDSAVAAFASARASQEDPAAIGQLTADVKSAADKLAAAVAPSAP